MRKKDCQNCARAGTDECSLCVNGSKYRPRKSRKRLESKSKRAGSDLERAARDACNKARLQKNSGARWNRPGDVLVPSGLADTKDRGYITAKGRKAFTVHLDDLLKIEEEAQACGLLPILAFCFKHSERLWAVVDYGELCSLLTYKKEGDRLDRHN